MKKCWFSQVIALSAIYSVLAQSEDLLLREQQTETVNDEEMRALEPSEEGQIFADSRKECDYVGDNSNELGPISTAYGHAGSACK